MRTYPEGSQCLATVPRKCLVWLTCSRQQFKYQELLLKIQISYFLLNVRFGNTGPGLLLWKAGKGLNGIGLMPSRNSPGFHHSLLFLRPASIIYQSGSVFFFFFMCTCLICISAWPLRHKSLQTLVYTYTPFFFPAVA